MTTSNPRYARKLVWAAVVALFVLHHDFWLWDSKTLVWGFLPMGLFYHSVFSLASAGVWAMANRHAWPTEIEAWADEFENSEKPQARGSEQ